MIVAIIAVNLGACGLNLAFYLQNPSRWMNLTCAFISGGVAFGIAIAEVAR